MASGGKAVLVMTLLLVAGAVGGSVARAETIEPPSFGLCSNFFVEGENKEYSDPTCTSKEGTPEFTWHPVNTGREMFYESGTSDLLIGSSEIKCHGVAAPGHYESPKTLAGLPFHLLRCTLAGQACQSLGAKEGEVSTSVMFATLGLAQQVIGHKLPQTLTALELAPEEGEAPFAQFSCGSTEITMRGALVAHIRDEKRTMFLEFKESKGKQAIEHLNGAPARPLEASVGGAPYQHVAVKGKFKERFQDVQINPVFSQS